MKTKTIRVKPNLTETPVDDICWFCDKDISCGKKATVLVLNNPSSCVADTIADCCPNVNVVDIDNEKLCGCYCNYVRSNGKRAFVNCSGKW